MKRKTLLGTGVLLMCVGVTSMRCGTRSVADNCTVACEKIFFECEPKERDHFDQCVVECSSDEGNQERAKCYSEISSCDQAVQSKCDQIETTVCHRAVKKINACQAALGHDASMKYGGWCSDQSTISTKSGGSKAVAFKSWSETYLACTIDAATCRCPGQPNYDEL